MDSTRQAGVAFVFDTSVGDAGVFRMGAAASPSMAANRTALLPVSVDRAMRVHSNTKLTFKLIVRNSWTAASMVEFYVNGVLGKAFSVGNRGSTTAEAARLTGSFANVGSAQVLAVHRLTLPLQ